MKKAARMRTKTSTLLRQVRTAKSASREGVERKFKKAGAGIAARSANLEAS